MDIFNPSDKTNMIPQTGTFLIADPCLRDHSFSRAVIFLCEHGHDGSIGFILNRPSGYNVRQLLPENDLPVLSVYEGGPVQPDALHMIHRIKHLKGGLEIQPGIFWGGSYKQLSVMGHPCTDFSDQVKLYKGYAGWDRGQLEEEIRQGAWIVAPFQKAIIFETEAPLAWSVSIRSLGARFAHLAHVPLYPQMN